MKYTLAAVAATGLFVSGALAQPHFTNSKINPQEGEPFKLTVSGCEEGCKITLQKGPNKDSLQDFRTLASKSFYFFFIFFACRLSRNRAIVQLHDFWGAGLTRGPTTHSRRD